MSQLAKVVLRTFRRPSGVLGRLAGWTMSRNNRERGLLVLDRLGIEPEDRVLEVGFGPGVSLARAAELAHRGQVVGVDHSELMWKTARKRNAKAVAAGRIELHLGTLENLPASAQPFDKAYAVNVFQFWPRPELELAALRSLLRPAGTLLLALQPRGKRHPTREDALAAADRIHRALTAAGFESIECNLLPTRPVETACVLGRAPAL